jgi:N-methylhydantoinase B
MKSKGLDSLTKNDVVSLRLPGAGGYGDPKARALSLILQDVRDGKISIESAHQDYGVKVTEELLSSLD